MGSKRRNLPRRSKPPQSAGGESSNSQLTGALPQEQRNPEPSDFASIKAGLDQANTIFHSRNEAQGSHQTLRLCLQTTALQGCLRVGSKSNQPFHKLDEFASFHANMIFQSETDSRGYEEAAREGERALLIENTIDPATQSLCPGKNASLSGSGKNLGEGIILKPEIVDPVRRNKIVKQTKIPEERRRGYSLTETSGLGELRSQAMVKRVLPASKKLDAYRFAILGVTISALSTAMTMKSGFCTMILS
ncbi:hypothetical protein Acr_05g0007000 [Actinidia rufa]|uniref:Uncharacterized protein n=1 Tax=Actinidia rufa TaxID=165716 RepID=A0A7J0EKR4_9ERIC|nr:hypothetical protein Acr_05g0007000 [Actinidia rufa]